LSAPDDVVLLQVNVQSMILTERFGRGRDFSTFGNKPYKILLLRHGRYSIF